MSLEWVSGPPTPFYEWSILHVWEAFIHLPYIGGMSAIIIALLFASVILNAINQR